MLPNGRQPADLGYFQRTIERFWSKVDKSGDCWIWQGARCGPNKIGEYYGSFSVAVNGKQVNFRASRLAWILLNGEIPDGYVMRHTCDTPLCVNPAHLEPGTQQNNVDDAVERLRHSIGERNRHAKLIADDVTAIRQSSESDKALADHFDVHPSTIYYARVGKKWKHLPGANPDFYNDGSRRGKYLSQQEREEIMRRREAGESLKDVAADYGIVPNYVSVIASAKKRAKWKLDTGDSK